jgi:AcrR family transcriptional regulator
MTASNRTGQHPLTVERIVDAACLIVERDGLSGLSMRKLGAELGVDPMAVYHHVAHKRELLALVTERTIGTMTPPDPTAPWDVRARQWAIRYWDVVVAHRELTLAGLSDPEIAGAGRPSTEPLLAAVAESGLPTDLVEPNAFLIVDAVHGSALAMGALDRHDTHGHSKLRAAFDSGIDTILAGITALAHAKRERTTSS